MAKWSDTNAKFWRLANLSSIRKMHGKTQEEVARDLDVSISTYRSWEQQKSSPTANRLARLALYFGCSADDFITVGSRPGDQRYKMVDVPVCSDIAAGQPMDMWTVDLEATVPAQVIDKHPVSVLMRVSGNSVNRRLRDGMLVLIDLEDREPTNERDLFAVCVNGDTATLKRYRPLENGCELLPDSYDPTIRPLVFDYNEDDTPEVTIMGKAVYPVAPLDFDL